MTLVLSKSSTALRCATSLRSTSPCLLLPGVLGWLDNKYSAGLIVLKLNLSQYSVKVSPSSKLHELTVRFLTSSAALVISPESLSIQCLKVSFRSLAVCTDSLSMISVLVNLYYPCSIFKPCFFQISVQTFDFRVSLSEPQF